MRVLAAFGAAMTGEGRERDLVVSVEFCALMADTRGCLLWKNSLSCINFVYFTVCMLYFSQNKKPMNILEDCVYKHFSNYSIKINS